MLPNFFLVGANKAGTSSVYRYLDAHPQVYMSPVKEPAFFGLDGVIPAPPTPDWPFGRDFVATREDYERLFTGVTTEIAIGEASTGYLRNEKAARRIHEDIPHARIIAILRDPAARAYSAYRMHVAKGLEPVTEFGKAVDLDLAGGTWRRYIQFGVYSEGLARYLELFGRDRVKVFLYEDLRDRPLQMLHDTFDFLEVDPDFTPDVSQRFNVSVTPKNTTVLRMTTGSSPARNALKQIVPSSMRSWMKRRTLAWNQTPPAPLSPEMRRQLIDIYADDIAVVEELTGRDLTAWKSV